MFSVKYKKLTSKYKCFREYDKNKLADRQQCNKNSQIEDNTNFFCYQGRLCSYIYFDYI